jgi:thiol-disulfide isomerase/thioredoxin
MHEAPKPVPALQFADGEGRALTLKEFHGKVVLLNVWATWCASCRKEMPTLDRLQAGLGGPDFQVVALSIDRKGPDVVRKFYAEIGIQDLSLFIDTSGAASQKLGVFGLPATLLIDRQGQELGRLIGPAEWDSAETVAFLKNVIAGQAGASSSTQQKENNP